MSWTAFSRTSSSLALALALAAGCAAQPSHGELLYADDFTSADNWILEAEDSNARVIARDGVLDIDTPKGLTLWFRHRLEGPVEITFDATAVAEGGPNDQVSDLNVFWMASQRDGSAPFPSLRGGRFAAYNDLHLYYVGLGGNRNTTTRFRRYVGDADHRPLLPEHDLSGPGVLLMPNRSQSIRLVADGSRIEYHRDGKRLFGVQDSAPYRAGWFALRTTFSHLRIENLRIHYLGNFMDDGRAKKAGISGRNDVDARGVGVYNARPLAKAP